MQITKDFPKKPGLYWAVLWNEWHGVKVDEHEYTDGKKYYKFWVAGSGETEHEEYFTEWYGPLELPED